MQTKRFKSAKKTVFGRMLCRILGDERGAVAMEYIVIALLVAAAVVGLVMVFSGNLRNMLGSTNEVMTKKKVDDIKDVGEKYNERQDKLKEQNDHAKEAGHKLGGDFTETESSN